MTTSPILAARRAAYLEGRHVIREISYGAETIVCTCGEVVTAPEDTSVRDRHAPLVAAWSEHRRAAGLPTPSVGRAMAAHRTGAWS